MGEAYHKTVTGEEHITAAVSIGALQLKPLHWYTLKVRTGGEKVAAAALMVRGYAPYCPVQKEFRRYSDRVKVIAVPIFPGYLFCQFDAREKLPIITSPGVEYILGSSEGPTPVPDEELLSIRRMIDAGASRTSGLEAGQRVRVTHGPLEGVEGVLVRDNHGSRLVVSIELVKQGAYLHINQDQVVSLERNQ